MDMPPHTAPHGQTDTHVCTHHPLTHSLTRGSDRTNERTNQHKQTKTESNPNRTERTLERTLERRDEPDERQQTHPRTHDVGRRRLDAGTKKCTSDGTDKHQDQTNEGIGRSQDCSPEMNFQRASQSNHEQRHAVQQACLTP